MTETGAQKLYSPRLLALSASLADYPIDDGFDHYGEARSRTCGSTIRLGLSIRDEAISRIGMQVSACAVGQSSAAIMAQGIEGQNRDRIQESLSAIENWLSGAGHLPAWPGFDALAPALPHPGRHEAILIPWRAAITALSSQPSSS